MGVDFLRWAGWLDAARTRGYLRVVALLNVAALVLLVATSRGGIDRNGFLLGTDFLSFWTTGHMLQEHANVYDVAAHAAAQRTFYAADDAYTAFFYPPSFLPFCWPLGLLGYFPALVLWLALTGAAYLFAVRQWLRRCGLAQPLLVLLAAFPPVLITIAHGQTSFLVAALLGLGALLVPSRPWLAGVLFGLATIKPQFGLLVPVALLLTREWRVIGGAVLGAALLGGVSTLAFGSQVWADWFHIGSAARGAMDQGAVGYAKMQSLLAAAMLLGAPSGLAYALQGALTLAVIGAVGWASWRRRFDLSLAALVLAGAPLATPFVLDYDLVLLAFPLIWLGAQAIGQDFWPWEKLVFAATFIAAAFARPLALNVGIPIMPLILIAFFVLLFRRVNESPRAGRVAAGAGSTLL
jgi:hypothetical protein